MTRGNAGSTPDIEWDWTVVQERVGERVVDLECLPDFEDAVARLCERIQDGGDPQWFEDRCPMFGVIWPAARALAGRLARADGPERGQRMIELGCGLALPSLVAAQRGCAVLATDQHPDAGPLLARNAARNGVVVLHAELDWRDEQQLRPFDWVVASDVLYAAGMAETAAAAFARLLAPGGRGVLADPGRPWLQEFAQAASALGLEVEVECTDDDLWLLELGK
jgi:predicted nicotinamide N-methyase